MPLMCFIKHSLLKGILTYYFPLLIIIINNILDYFPLLTQPSLFLKNTYQTFCLSKSLPWYLLGLAEYSIFLPYFSG